MKGKYTKQDNLAIEIVLFCTPAGARTLDTLIKSQVLYQLSYKRIAFEFCGCKGTAFFYNNQIFSSFFCFFSTFSFLNIYNKVNNIIKCMNLTFFCQRIYDLDFRNC